MHHHHLLQLQHRPPVLATDQQEKTRRVQHAAYKFKKGNRCVQPYWAPQNAEPRMVQTQVDSHQTTTLNAWDDAWNDHIHNRTHQDLEFSGFASLRSKALAGSSRDAIDQTHKITTAGLFNPCLASESSKHHKPSKRSQMRAFCNHPRKKERTPAAAADPACS